MKPKTNRQRKERDADKDTVVAYHEFIQGRIHGELNGVSIGPGRLFSKIAFASAVFGFVCMIVGILVITLRHRHVYLVDWNAQFLGPFFLIMFLLCASFSVFLLMIAKRKTNDYRKDLAFRPIGDYGVAVVHKSKLNYDDAKKSDLKSGTTPHNVRHPGRPGVNDRGNRGDPSRSRGYDNRGYSRDDRDGGRRDYRDRPDDRDPRDRRRPPPGDRDRRRPPPGPPGEDRRRRPDDRDPRGRGDPNRERRPRPPPGSEEDKRRMEARRRYEEDKRRRFEEDRRRAELRKQAEADSYEAGRMLSSEDERGVDVEGGLEGGRKYEITTHVKVSRDYQPTDESDL